MNLNIPDKDIYTYEFSDILLTHLGIDKGIMQKTHSRYIYMLNKPEEFSKAQLDLEYDILYGNHYIYDHVEKYERVDMKMGIDTITVNGVKKGKRGMIGA